MENRLNDIDELIGKYLAGEASDTETRQVETWSGESEDNRRYFNQFKMIFERAASVKETIDVDADAAWSKLKSRIRNGEGKVVPMRTSSTVSLFWKIAASLIVILGVGLFTYRMLQPDKPIEVIAEKRTVTDTLPDGSKVVLNKQTQLSYVYDKKKKEHTVKLKGEAYFNIQHEEKKSFIIEVSGVFIRDIGTSFNVKAYPESNTIEVVVEEGEVMFYTETDSGISLKAQGKGTYNKITKSFSIEQPEPNVAAYKTKLFVFSGTSLGTVIDELNSVYDKKLIINDSLRNCPLTVTFNNEEIEEIAAVIGETLGLTLKKSATGIRLEGSACEK